MSKLRPSGSGRDATCATFMRRTATPAAALVISADPPLPGDWPSVSGAAVSDTQIGHAVGWVCEIRADHVVLLNPLGEGVFRMALPEIEPAWLHDVRSSASAAIYLLDRVLDAGDPASASAAVDAAASAAPIAAGTVRTAISETYGQVKEPGRNDPCPCGSGKKYKHCHLR
jgi:SEC-C motif